MAPRASGRARARGGGADSGRPSRPRARAASALLGPVLVAAGLAAAAAPAGAVPGVADAALDPGENPACPDSHSVAHEAAERFSDVEADHTHAADIGCLVYYGITVGAGDGSHYDPGSAVKRWQMALFMARAAERAGLTLPDADQGFTDLTGLDPPVVARIEAVAALGIIPGTSAAEFSPGLPVLRGDMALHLIRMLDLVTGADSPVDVEVDEASGAATLTRGDGSVITPDDTFDDVAGKVPAATEHAVGAIFELGVTVGKRPGIYDPDGPVTRAQMATFIVRLLGHSILRPDGPIVLDPWAPPAPEAETVGDWEVGTGSGTGRDFTFAYTSVNVGSDSSPHELLLVIRCPRGGELEIFVHSSQAHFSGTPVLEYRFGGEPSPTSVEMVPSEANNAGFLSYLDRLNFVLQLLSDTSGVLHVELWDRPTDGGESEIEAGGVLGTAGAATQVDPILQECGILIPS